MTLHRTFARSLVCGLALVSATIVFQVADAESADRAGDAQLQAIDLLSGTVGGLPKSFARSAVSPAEGEQTPRLDPQEQARQLILGKPPVGGTTRLALRVGAKRETTQAALQRGHRGGYADPQEAARRMILGNAEAATGRQRHSTGSTRCHRNSSSFGSIQIQPISPNTLTAAATRKALVKRPVL